jgi:sugar-specific transcriptional regulator TrmB
MEQENTANLEEAVEVLQQLGLKEYEARCFVGLSRLQTGTAKKLRELTEVPRTRIYDAIRVLEAQGLVEVQHSSPQHYRTVSLDEAIETLHDQYEARVNRLENALETIEIVDVDDDTPVQQVWAMTGRDAIENRTNELVGEATDEVVLVLGDESLLTDDLVEVLNEVGNGVELLVGAVTKSLQDEIQTAVSDATTYVSGHEWLHGENATEEDVAIGRLLLIDRSRILVSSIKPDSKEEQAIFCVGFANGLVVIARRAMAQGLLPVQDPQQ